MTENNTIPRNEINVLKWKYEVLCEFRQFLSVESQSVYLDDSKLFELAGDWALSLLNPGDNLNSCPREHLDFARQLLVVKREIIKNESIKKITEACLRCYWPSATKWNGVNLGGWLLLEPGPAYPLFDKFNDPKDEYSLMTTLHPEDPGVTGADVMQHHRTTHITLQDFQQIKNYGYNSVRIPFGYWIITGPSNNDPYVGPALTHLDRAISYAEQTNLQVILDLHGCPGGQSGDVPSGRAKRGWKWQNWRREESLNVISIIAKRYAHHKHITGFQVTNEPASSIPIDILVQFYEDAITIIRRYMPAYEVAILLPVYEEHRLEEVEESFHSRNIWRKYDNIALDLHYYHCFGGYTRKTSHETHLRWTRKHGTTLQNLPGSCVGEWSLARPGRSSDAELREWGEVQKKQYDKSSHGHFFWNWCDYPQLPEWDVRQAISKGWLRPPSGIQNILPPRISNLINSQNQLQNRIHATKQKFSIRSYFKMDQENNDHNRENRQQSICLDTSDEEDVNLTYFKRHVVCLDTDSE